MRNDELNQVEVVFSPPATGLAPSIPFLDQLARLTRTQLALACLFVGLAIGLTIGWGIWPVQWTSAGFSDLTPDRQAQVIRLASWVYAFSGNEESIRQVINWKTAAETGCQMVALTGDEADRSRLVATLGVAGISCEVPHD